MCISEISGCNLIGLASSLAIALSQNLTHDEITVLAAFFTSLGDNLALISAASSLPNDDCTCSDSIKNSI